RSMLGGVLAVLGIYLLVNLALLHVLPYAGLAGSVRPIADAVEVVFGAHTGMVFGGMALLIFLSMINAVLLAAPRIVLAMSRDGLFFAQAAEVNAGGTPAVALGVSTGVASLFLLSASFETVINVLTFFIVSNYGLLFVSLFVLRWREPTLVRPYRAWGF